MPVRHWQEQATATLTSGEEATSPPAPAPAPAPVPTSDLAKAQPKSRKSPKAKAPPSQSEANADDAEADFEPGSAPENVEQAVLEFARTLGEAPQNIRQRRDVMGVLELMGKGVTVALTIERPRFLASVAAQDLGLDNLSPAAQTVLKDYFRLGKRSLLPKSLQDELNSVESNARHTLERFAFKSHWGYFVPATAYAKWKEANAAWQSKFLALRDRVAAEYDKLMEEVVESYRPMAEDGWRRSLLKETLTARLDHEAATGQELSQAEYEALLARLKAGEGRAEAVEAYLGRIRQALPGGEEIAARFVYRVELGFIPLPSVLAKDVDTADRIYQQRVLVDAEFQVELARTRAEKDKAEAEVWAARLAHSAHLQEQRQVEQARSHSELARLRLQEEMERDVIEQARTQKKELVDNFFQGIVGQINTLIFEVCDNAASSMERNQGKLTGSVSMQLRNLLTQLEEWNFAGDTSVENQIARLRAALPPVVVAGGAGARGGGGGKASAGAVARIDTARVGRVVGQLRREAEAVLIDLGHQPITRAGRHHNAASEDGEAAALLPLPLLSSGEGDAAGGTAGRTRRRREWVTPPPAVPVQEGVVTAGASDEVVITETTTSKPKRRRRT